MKEYTIKISELLVKEIEIIASNENEAIKKVLEKYNNGEIILYSDDFIGEPEFKIV